MSGLLLLLVDAMRWDYVERTTFLRRLARRSAVGRFQEPFGFTPRAAYFRGMDTEPDGFTFMFEWNPSKSPFGAARFTDGACAAAPRREPRVREGLAARARDLSSPFARAYISPLAIPLNMLSRFNATETQSPWAEDAPRDNLFRQLTAAGLPWHTSAWPDTNGLADAAIVERAVNAIGPEHRFAFVHLSALDGAGHAYGPGDHRTQAVLEESDRLAQTLIEHCQRTWTDPRILVFGDHGMVRVVRSVDVMASLHASGLRFARDVGYFVDSTVVRFWYFTADARRRVHELFADTDYGRFVDAVDRTQFGLDRCSWRNGEDFFLAHPGIVFSPSFFGASPPEGMHGYDPRAADNMGAFLYWSASDEQARDAGVVSASRLYATCLHGLGVAAPAEAGVAEAVRIDSCPPRRSTYTVEGSPDAEDLVTADLAAIRAGVTATVDNCEAIVIGGGFGRGEGYVRTTPSPCAVNDYDVLVVGGTVRGDIRALHTTLTARCRVDALDLSHLPAGYSVGACQMGFDLRYGSAVVFGQPDAVRDWGAAAPDSLTMADAWLGIANRVCGLLEVFASDAPASPMLRRQLIKLGVAIGDACLIDWHDYHPLLSVRRARFAALSRAAAIDRTCADTIADAYRDKLQAADGNDAWHVDSLSALCRAVRLLAGPSAAGDGWHQDVARLAVDGRRRQCLVHASHLHLNGARPNPLPAALAASLTRVYASIWPLLFEIQSGDPSHRWRGERDAVIGEWLKVVH